MPEYSEQPEEVQNLNLPFDDEEIGKLAQRVERDYLNANPAHEKRMRRFAEYEAELWQVVEVQRDTEAGASNYKVPLLAWILWRWVADMVEKIFGDDGEVRAEPTEPSDRKSSRLASEFIQWAFFSDMNATLPVIQSLKQCGLLGRTHIYLPWRKESYLEKDPQTEEISERVTRMGPEWEPIHPDDLIVPAEAHARTIHDFSFVIRRFYTTPQALLDAERDGLYFGVSDPDDPSVFDDVVRMAQQPLSAQRVLLQNNQTREEQEDIQGINPRPSTDGGSECLECWEWHGHWRPKLPPMVRGGVEQDGQRYPDQLELRVTKIPSLKRVIGVHDLMDLHPRRKDRRPIESIGLFAQDMYWCPGIAQVLRWSIEELTVNHNLMTTAVQHSTMPGGVYEPAAGLNPEKFKVEPGVYQPVADVTRIKQLEIRADLNGCVLKEQMVLAYVERLWGISDQSLGRSSDKPNDPKTATGQALQDAGGNKRLNLDVKVIREQLQGILRRVWELYRNFASEETFFRVLGEDPEGLLDLQNGFAKIGPADFASTYDFKLKFASSYYSREMEKQRSMEVYGLMMQNPLVMTNPVAMWQVTNDLWLALGRRDLASVLPPPGPVDMPKPPANEWNMLLQGQPIKVHPMDNDQEHITDHDMRVDRATPDQQPQAIEMSKHSLAHRQQMQLKMRVQAVAGQLQQQALDGGGQPGQAPPQGGPPDAGAVQ